MVFSSLEFLFLFLPFSVFGYYTLLKWGYARFIIPFLFFVSLFYYGYWKPENTWIIIASIAINYAFGQWISPATKWRKLIFIAGLFANLASLAYFKYTDFAITTVNTLADSSIPLTGIILPIGISFFTFQQIAYLSDIYTKKHDPTSEGFFNYCCFVCFFPQLVAGPIVHHKEMMPQFADANNRIVNWENIYGGLVILSIGLAKKVLIADNLSPIVHYSFDVAPSLTFLEAYFGSLAYTLQLYFDFSGYSDMAIGCALFFNIHIPQNFNSPYHACDIQDFWRRWHITLSRWLRDYLYIPLGGNRQGNARTLGNLFVTFLLGGLWHGAAWTFVLWGIMHGTALVVHRLWSQFVGLKIPKLIAWVITFSFVNIAWIVFRAPDFACVEKFKQALLGNNGIYVTEEFSSALTFAGRYSFKVFTLFLFAVMISIFLKNTSYILKKMKYNKIILIYCSTLLASVTFILLMSDLTQEFIYFQF